MKDYLHILVVDDDEVDRIAVHHALQQSGISVRIDEADSLRAVRRALQGGPYDCLLLDYHLGDGHATTLLEEHSSIHEPDNGERRRPDLPPVIILTGSGNERVAVELMRAGAIDYMPKQELTPSRIAQSVRNALRVHESENAVRQAKRDLEARVVERTAELADANRVLQEEMVSRVQAEERARSHLEQLAHVARLSTLGEMAAEIAHELNQPLGAIANYAHGCSKRIDNGTADTETIQMVFDTIAKQAERAGKIIHRLRSLVARRQPEMITTDLNRLINEILELQASETEQHQIRMHMELEPGLPSVRVDAIQVQQVLLNLLRNSIEVLRELPPERRNLTLVTRKAGEETLRVSVRDEGPGCDPETLQRLFDPFFTTKSDGMGMGLVISRSIIEAHGGELWVVPNPGDGLTFHFTIPIEEAGA